MRVKLGLLIAVCLVTAAGLVPAHAKDLYYVSGAGEQFRGYSQPAMVISPGDRVTYVNTDIVFHDVVATTFGPDVPLCATYGYPAGQCPRFWSSLIGLGQTTPINRIDALPAGTYEFKCSIHSSMKGTLVVLPY